MKSLLTTLTALTIGTSVGNLTEVLKTNVKSNNISDLSISPSENNIFIFNNQQKIQQDTIYIDEKGNQITTSKHDLSEINTKEVIQIGFFKNLQKEVQVVKMPITVEKVPDKLPLEITSLSEMFADCLSFNQDISNWNVSNVTNMKAMFFRAFSFNQNISNWNVSNVTDMKAMFLSCKLFNQDISNWNVSNVTDTSGMFDYAESFNQDISNWNVSNVTDMKAMFFRAFSFNQDISNWNVSNVIKYDDFATNSGIIDKNKLPKFINFIYEFIFNKNKNNELFWTDWGIKRNNSCIYTFELPKLQFIPNDLKYIKFYNKDKKILSDKSYYSWGNTRYQTKYIINDINLSNYLRNVKVTKDGVNNPSNSCNIIICQDTKWYLSASIEIKIKMGLTFYWENGKWFFQIIITHYGETWGSASGGAIWTSLGSYFKLSFSLTPKLKTGL